MTLAKRLTMAVAVVGIGYALAVFFRFYPTQSQQPPEPARRNKVTLSWDKAARATSYNIYRRPQSIDAYTKMGSSATTSYEDPTVQSGLKYCYVVTSVDSQGQEGVRSKEMCVTVPRP